MHTATVFAFIVVGLAAIIYAQETCPGRVGVPNCSQAPNRGSRRGNNCRSRAGQMWAWNSRRRRCETLSYLGCRGNSNRFCTRDGCEIKCLPGRTTQQTTARTTSRPTTRPTTAPITSAPPAVTRLVVTPPAVTLTVITT